jgi:hypothetical protein
MRGLRGQHTHLVILGGPVEVEVSYLCQFILIDTLKVLKWA